MQSEQEAEKKPDESASSVQTGFLRRFSSAVYSNSSGALGKGFAGLKYVATATYNAGTTVASAAIHTGIGAASRLKTGKPKDKSD